MTLPDDMAVFVRIVENGSFAGAARELSLTPSAVSKILSRLEQRLSTQLLTRTTRRLALTAEGETYLLRCKDILAAIEAAEAEVSSSDISPRGHIRVATGTAVGRRQLTKLLPAFLAQYPDISVDLNISEQRIDLVAKQTDVALRTGDLPDSSLVARKIVDAQRLICASPRYLDHHGTPERPEDLLDHNCILFSNFPHLGRWPFRTGKGVVRIQVKGNVMTDNADVALDLAIAGHGIVRMIDIHLSEPIRRGLLVPLFEAEHMDEPIPVWAVTPSGRNHIPRVRALLDFLAEQFGTPPA